MEHYSGSVEVPELDFVDEEIAELDLSPRVKCGMKVRKYIVLWRPLFQE